MKLWKLLTDTGFTGSPSNLTEDDVRQMVDATGLPESEIEAALSGLREFQKKESELQVF